MKKKYFISFILTIFFSVSFFNGFSQEIFSKYLSSIDNKPYNISISPDKKKNNKFNLYIDLISFDNLYTEGGIMLNEKQYNNFIQTLNSAKKIYKEWIKTAIANNITEVNKRIELKNEVYTYFLFNNDWQYQGRALTYYFKVREFNGSLEYLLSINTGELTSETNQFIKMDGLAMIFKTPDEIESFLNTISIDKITQYLNNPKVEDLFKN